MKGHGYMKSGTNGDLLIQGHENAAEQAHCDNQQEDEESGQRIRKDVLSLDSHDTFLVM